MDTIAELCAAVSALREKTDSRYVTAVQLLGDTALLTSINAALCKAIQPIIDAKFHPERLRLCTEGHREGRHKGFIVTARAQQDRDVLPDSDTDITSLVQSYTVDSALRVAICEALSAIIWDTGLSVKYKRLEVKPRIQALFDPARSQCKSSLSFSVLCDVELCLEDLRL